MSRLLHTSTSESPCSPTTYACTCVTSTPIAAATIWRNRAVSSIVPVPNTRPAGHRPRSRIARRPTSSHRPGWSRPAGWRRGRDGTRRARPSPRSPRCARGGRAGSDPGSGPSPPSGRRRASPRGPRSGPRSRGPERRTGSRERRRRPRPPLVGSSMSTSTSSVGMPRRTSALAAAAPTNPAPTMPTFTRLTLSVGTVRPRSPRDLADRPAGGGTFDRGPPRRPAGDCA